MKAEIKERLEQIQRGEVPRGYKRGKLGIVPEDWEDVSFSELFTSTSDYTDDLEQYPLYSLTIENGITAKTERYDRSHLVKKENSFKIVRPNDFAYNPMNVRFGAVARHKGNVPVAVSGYYDIFTTVNESDLEFMDSFLTWDSMITYYNRMSTGSLIEKQRVHFSDFLKFRLPMPSLKERKRITTILSIQNEIIELQDQKIEQLQQLKKYFLTKMFPRKGANVPESRFPEFSDPWKQRKIGEIAGKTYGGGTPKTSVDEFWGGEIPWIQSSNLSEDALFTVDIQKHITESGLQKSAAQLVPKDSIAVVSHVGVGKLVLMPFEYTTSQDFISLSALNAEPAFTCYALYRRLLQDLHIVQGSAIKGITKNALLDKTISVPSVLEQVKVGSALRNLDNLITLHQCKRDEEIKKKKALMQLLLTGVVRVS